MGKIEHDTKMNVVWNDPSIITLKSALPRSNFELDFKTYPLRNSDGGYALRSYSKTNPLGAGWCATNSHGFMQCDLTYNEFYKTRDENKVFHIEPADFDGHVTLKNEDNFCARSRGGRAFVCNQSNRSMRHLFTPHVEEGGHCALTACRDPYSSQCPRNLRGIKCTKPDPVFCTANNKEGFVSGCVGR